MAGIASAIGAGAAVLGAGSSLIKGLTSGSGGSATAQNINSNTTTDSSSHGTVATSFDPTFQNATTGLINDAVGNAGGAYQNYGGMIVAPFNGTQQDAFWGVKNNPNMSSPYFGAGMNAYSQAGQFNPLNAAQPFLDKGSGFLSQGQGFLDKANGLPGGLQAAQPYASMASGSFTGDNVARYMDPYLNTALESNNRVANQNLTNNLLPALNSQFIGSGGGARAGNNAYSHSMNGVLNNWENNLFNSNGLMTNAAYTTAGQNFQSDQNRYAGLAGTMGGLANSTLSTYGNLAGSAFGGANSAFGGAGTAANAASAAQNNLTSLGSAYTNAGNTVSNVGLSNDAALLGIGNQLQASQQKAADYGTSQFEAQRQWPFQTSKYLADILQSTRVPTTVTSDNTAHSNSSTVGTSGGSGSSSSTPSPLGAGLGLLSGLKGLGALDGLSGIFNRPQNGTDPSGNPTLPDGTPIVDAKRGGHFSGGRMNTPAFARGGFIGMDAASSPSFVSNPGYWSAQPLRTVYRPDGGVAAYYQRGGRVGYFDAGGPVPARGHFNGDPDLQALVLQALQNPSGFGRPQAPVAAVAQPEIGGSANGDPGGSVSSPGDNGGISGTGETYRRGGRFRFAAGGAAPVIKATRAATDKFTAAARAKANKPAPGLTRPLALPAASGYFR